MQMGDCVEGVEHRASKASNGGPHCPSNKHTGHPPRKPRATGDAVCPHGGREVKEPSGAYENKNEYFQESDLELHKEAKGRQRDLRSN